MDNNNHIINTTDNRPRSNSLAFKKLESLSKNNNYSTNQIEASKAILYLIHPNNRNYNGYYVEGLL